MLEMGASYGSSNSECKLALTRMEEQAARCTARFERAGGHVSSCMRAPVVSFVLPCGMRERQSAF